MTTPAGLLPLPDPEDPELVALLPSREVLEAYRFLYERRDSPPTMPEWEAKSRELFGQANSNTGRRLRELRKWFYVPTTPKPNTKDYLYELVGRLPAPNPDQRPISPKLQAEVFARKGRYCAMCGRGPQDGVKLQIDHMIPSSPPWNGPTDLTNLEPLCVEHNHGKQAFFATYDNFGAIISTALPLPDPWLRIGELLKGFYDVGEPCPVELIEVVARPTHAGDYKKRLRELRFVLDWPIVSQRRKAEDGVTHVHYMLTGPAPEWPVSGPQLAVNDYERRRKARRRAEAGADIAGSD